MSIYDYKQVADDNTTISGINIAEGCPPSGINDAIRQIMADVANDVAPLREELFENEGAGPMLREDIVPNGRYSLAETDTGMKWIDGKTIYAKTFNMGALPNNGTKVVPHGIANLDSHVALSGIAISPANSLGIALPRSSASGPAYNIDVSVFEGNMRIITGSDMTTYSTSFLTFLYTKG